MDVNSLLFATEMPKQAQDKMLFAALQLFTAKGFQETSILDVVESARVSKTTFYNFFASKEELLVCLFEQLVEEILREVKLAVEKETRMAYKAFAGIRRYVDLCSRHTTVAQLLLVASVGVSRDVESVRRKAHARFAELIYQTVQGIMPDSVADTDIRIVSKAMVGAINEVIIQRVIVGDHESEIDHSVRMLNRIVVVSFIHLTMEKTTTAVH
jgi:AcrR family transcriptional regulator